MSDQTQGNPLFADFKPAPEMPTIPFQSAPDIPVKRERKPRTSKATPHKTPTAVPKQKRKPKPPRQPAAPEQVARPKASSLDLQTVLRACANLKEEDFAAFDALFNLPAAQRERILAAIGKVFA